MKKSLRSLVATFTMLLAFSLAATAQTEDPRTSEDLVMITGTHWTQSARDSKLAFLMGLGNFFEVEQALRKDNPPKDDESLIPVFARGLDDLTLTEIMQELDKWYATNSDRLYRPVIETLYFEIALPRSAK